MQHLTIHPGPNERKRCVAIACFEPVAYQALMIKTDGPLQTENQEKVSRPVCMANGPREMPTPAKPQ